MAKKKQWHLSWNKNKPLKSHLIEILKIRNKLVCPQRGAYLEEVRKELERREREGDDD